MSRRRRAPVAAAALLAGLLAACSEPDREAPGSGDQGAGGTPPLQYVALGDSYATAPGVPEQVRSHGCRRSTRNFAHQVLPGLRDGYTLLDRSCSGASTDDLLQPQRPGVPPQLQSLGTEADLVTIRMGANDANLFGRTLFGCAQLSRTDPDGSPCRDRVTAQGGNPVQRVLSSIQQRLTAGLQEVKRRAPDARLLLVGYPTVFPQQGSCPTRLPLATGDVAYAAEIMAALDVAQRSAARDAGVEFVGVREATREHHICAEEPWVQGMRAEAGEATPFHPHVEEQEAVARLVLEALAQDS